MVCLVLVFKPVAVFIEERMSWVKKRNTTRKEDKAYSLFEILNVQIPLLYGEGEDRAFGRLREEITKHDRDLSNLRSTGPRLDKKQRLSPAPDVIRRSPLHHQGLTFCTAWRSQGSQGDFP